MPAVTNHILINAALRGANRGVFMQQTVVQLIRHRVGGIVLLAIMCLTCMSGFSDGERGGRDLSDMNRDGRIDTEDLALFSIQFEHVQWETINWCSWLEANEEDPRFQQYDILLAYIRDRFRCGPVEPDDPLVVTNAVRYPTRMALGPNGIVYVTDAVVGSVYLFEPEVSLVQPMGEIKGFGKPLGIAVTVDGNIFVGDHEDQVVKRCTQQGNIVQSIGAGQVRMPSDLALDRDGNLYVADSESNVIWVYDQGGDPLRVIRSGELNFPSCIRICYPDEGTGASGAELYVGDKGSYLIKVFDLQGNYLRSFGGFPEKSGMISTTWDWEGHFVAIQDLVLGQSGNLMVLDGYMVNIQEITADDGSFVRALGERGTGPGQMQVPMDLLLLPGGELLVSDAVNRRLDLVEVFQ